jgi:uncharacterized phage-like protein YoqJ
MLASYYNISMSINSVDADNVFGRICCFSGHRNIERSLLPILKRQLRETAEELVLCGIQGFICGGAVGFDTLAAETVLELRARRPELILTLALPFKGQSSRWTGENKRRYERIREMADEVIFVSEEYSPYCMQKRNRFMVEHSGVCVCYLTSAGGGTAYTVSYALSAGLRVINLAMKM